MPSIIITELPRTSPFQALRDTTRFPLLHETLIPLHEKTNSVSRLDIAWYE